MSANPEFAGLSVVIRDAYLQTTLTESFMHGIYTVIICITLYAIFSNADRRSHSNTITIAIVVMYILATIHLAERWDLIRQAFVFHGQTEDTTVDYIIVQPVWEGALGSAAFVANTLMADSVIIWRCWVVWNRNWRAIIIPLLSMVAGTVFAIGSLIQQAKPTAIPISALINWSTPYFSLSVFTTLLSTLLIVLRILLVTRGNGGISNYRRVIEIVVESAMLYSITFIVFLVMYTKNDFNSGYPEDILAEITGIAPTLIVARVSFGLARPDESWSQPGSSIRFRFPSGRDRTTVQVPETMVFITPEAHSNLSVQEVKPLGSATSV